jgi:hypothetical protein
LAERQEGGAATVSQEAEGADANEAAGQHMQQEATQELWCHERHHSLVISVGIVSPAEGDLMVGEGNETVVGEGDAVGVAGEVAEDMMGTAEGWFGIDDPVLTEQGAQESAEGFLVL